jgi:putative hydrolase of the HAD superfamily
VSNAGLAKRTTKPAVVWDLDDTLVMEADYVRSGFDAAATQLGLAEFSRVCWRLFQEGVRRTTFDLALQEMGLPVTPERLRELVGAYRSHRPRIHLLPGVREALVELRAADVFLGIVTDGPALPQRRKIEATGLRTLTDAVVLTEDLGVGFGKPSTKPFEIVAARAARSAMLYVGDNPLKDFQAPLALGWSVLRVRLPESEHAAVDTPPAIAEADSTQAMLAWVRHWTRQRVE